MTNDSFSDCEGTQTFAVSMLPLLQAPPFRAHLLPAPNHNPQVIPHLRDMRMHQTFSRDVSHSDLVGILEFIYNGEVSIEQECLPGFLAVAETLRIRGLTGEVCCLTKTTALLKLEIKYSIVFGYEYIPP